MTAACYTGSTYSRTYTAAPSGGYVSGRPGQVVAVRETVHEVRGQPVAGAAAGGVIGGLVTGSWWGAAAGAATGGLLSSGGGASGNYEVLVQFQDGSQQAFNYPSQPGVPPPFQPGEPVIATPNGLQPAG